MPACDAGPELRVLAASVDGAARTAAVRFSLETAADGVQPDAIAVVLDGAEVPASAVDTSADPAEVAIHLAHLAPGKHRLALRASDASGRAAEPVELPLWVEDTPFEWRDSTLYMFMIDRFANGRTDNDAAVGAPVLPPADWHGGDLWGATTAVEDGYFDRLGVDVIWLSPVNRQVNGHFLGRDDALHVSFLGTHDSSRMASLAAVDPARECIWPEAGGDCAELPVAATDPAVYARLARAMTLLFTLPGRPLLYYGDEVALPGGRDPDNRRDMPWAGALADLALSDTTLSDAQLVLRDRVAALGTARRESLALRRGERFLLLAEPDLYVYGYATADPHDLAVVAVNRGAAVTARAVGALDATALGDVTTLEAVAGAGEATLDGRALTLSVPAGEAVVLRPSGG